MPDGPPEGERARVAPPRGAEPPPEPESAWPQPGPVAPRSGPLDDLMLAGIWFFVGGVGGLVLALDPNGAGDRLLVPWQVVSQEVAAALTGACVSGGLAWAAARALRLRRAGD